MFTTKKKQHYFYKSEKYIESMNYFVATFIEKESMNVVSGVKGATKTLEIKAVTTTEHLNVYFSLGESNVFS